MAVSAAVLTGQTVIVPPENSAPPIVGHMKIEVRGFEPTTSDRTGPGPHNSSLTGHIFIEVTQNTDSGPMRATYGFYPDSNNHNLGIIRGPGLLRSEDRCDSCTPESIAKHYGAVQDSVDIDITGLQRHNLFKKINEWNLKDYQLTDSNCIDFVDSAVRSLGYPTPDRAAMQTPLGYMRLLKQRVVQENRRREQIAEKKSKVNDLLQKGWIACTCPTLHTSSGVVIDGVRYHSPSIRCPQ